MALKSLTNSLLKQIFIAVLGYIGISALIYLAFLVYGAPFSEQQILLHSQTAMERFWNFQTASIVMLVEVGIILLITRGYKKNLTVMEKPEPKIAKQEIYLLLIYLVCIQLGGVIFGKILGMHPISFHLAGSIYGTNDHISIAEMFTWAAYNFTFYVIIPLTYFMKQKGYSLRQLNIISNRNVKRDIGVIFVVLALESAIQLGGFSDALLRLSWQEMLQGGFLAFIFNLFGTALPATIFIYALLFPRYQAMYKNQIVVIILGGLTYMIAHFFDSWMVFTSVGTFFASFGALFLQYFMPGVIKSVLTYRTGNPWVHMWAYYAIAPHVILDAPHFIDKNGH